MRAFFSSFKSSSSLDIYVFTLAFVTKLVVQKSNAFWGRGTIGTLHEFIWDLFPDVLDFSDPGLFFI